MEIKDLLPVLENWKYGDFLMKYWRKRTNEVLYQLHVCDDSICKCLSLNIYIFQCIVIRVLSLTAVGSHMSIILSRKALTVIILNSTFFRESSVSGLRETLHGTSCVLPRTALVWVRAGDHRNTAIRQSWSCQNKPITFQILWSSRVSLYAAMPP